MSPATMTRSKAAAAKLDAGEIIGLDELLAIEDCDIRLEHIPEDWCGRIKNLADLKSRIRYELGADGAEWLVLRLAHEYPVEADRINTVPKLLWWIAHLVEKTWMTREALSVLIEVVREKNRMIWGAVS